MMDCLLDESPQTTTVTYPTLSLALDAGDPQIMDLFAAFVWVVVPVVNPDGYVSHSLQSPPPPPPIIMQ